MPPPPPPDKTVGNSERSLPECKDDTQEPSDYAAYQSQIWNADWTGYLVIHPAGPHL